jgi:tetratricopeptide (TPR) repeat protein
MQTAPSAPDNSGLPLSIQSIAAAEGYRECIMRWRAYDLGAMRCVNRAIEEDEGFALAYAVRAFLNRAQGAMDDARADAAHARALAASATRGERGAIECIATIIAGENDRALDMLRAHLTEFPQDDLSVWIWYIFAGLQGWREDRYAFTYALLSTLPSHYEEEWWFLGALSYLCHEMDRLAESRRFAERALARYPRDAGASHSLSHVFYEQNDHTAGISFLNGWMPGYSLKAPLFGHLAWHLALFELAAGHYTRVLDVYDQYIAPSVMYSRLALADTASLLWRLQIYEGADRALPWQSVRQIAERLAPLPGYAFADVHAAMAYGAAGDEAAMRSLIDGLSALDAQGHPLAGSVTLPIVRGLHAFSSGAYDETVRQLAPVMGEVVRIGGSHAQREVIEDTLLQAYLRTERFDAAEALLRTRLGRRETARDHFWIGRAQAASGRTDMAAASFAAARDGWPDADPAAPEIVMLTRALGTLG